MKYHLGNMFLFLEKSILFFHFEISPWNHVLIFGKSILFLHFEISAWNQVFIFGKILFTKVVTYLGNIAIYTR
jgi:hypothetical protein